jgi:hypothetical protein
MLRRIRKAIYAAAAVTWVAAVVVKGLLDNSYVIGAPRAPDPATMRIVPYVVKRVVVYLSEEQMQVLSLLKWAQIFSGVSILVNFLLSLKWPMSSKE